MKKIAVVTVFCLITGLLSGCGFHLRGNNNTEHSKEGKVLSSFTLTTTKYKNLKKSLASAAYAQDIQLNENSDIKLTINKLEKNKQRATANKSVSTDQFRLKLSVSYTIIYQGIELQPQSITRQSIFQNDADQTIGKSYEREKIYQELTDELANALLEQLQILNQNPPQCDCDETKIPAAQQ